MVNPVSERIGSFFSPRNEGTDVDAAFNRARNAESNTFTSGPLRAFRTGRISRGLRNDIQRGIENLSSSISGLFGRQNEEATQASSRATQYVEDGEVPSTSQAPDPLPISIEYDTPLNITAEYLPVNTTEAKLNRLGFSPLPDGAHVVSSLNRSNLIQHVDGNGNESFLNSRNFASDDLNNPLSLILPRQETDQELRDPDMERERQASFLSSGG